MLRKRDREAKTWTYSALEISFLRRIFTSPCVIEPTCQILQQIRETRIFGTDI